MKTVISYFFILFFIFQGIVFFRPLEVKVLPGENRSISPFPDKMVMSKRGIEEFFSGIDSFLADRLLFRAETFELLSRVESRFNDVPDFNLAYRGKDGWLFLGKNQSIAKLMGSVQPKRPSKLIEDFKSILPEIDGIQTFFILGPDKSSVYPEYLPDFVRPVPVRYVQAYLDQLENTEAVEVVDPTEVLGQNKKQGLLYYRTDTHWNLPGASLAVETFIDGLNRSIGRDERIILPDYGFLPLPPV